jgi:hypothetical protein
MSRVTEARYSSVSVNYTAGIEWIVAETGKRKGGDFAGVTLNMA